VGVDDVGVGVGQPWTEPVGKGRVAMPLQIGPGSHHLGLEPIRAGEIDSGGSGGPGEEAGLMAAIGQGASDAQKRELGATEFELRDHPGYEHRQTLRFDKYATGMSLRPAPLA
jgi:hypothetical protein